MDLETRIKWVVARLTGRPEAQDVTLEEFDSENFNPELVHSFEETDPECPACALADVLPYIPQNNTSRRIVRWEEWC